MNPDALLTHLYLIGIAVVLAVAFGPAWALLPLAVGFVQSYIATVTP